MDEILSRLKLEGLEPLCWAEIWPQVDYEKRCRFGSSAGPDPRFHYLAVTPEEPGEPFLVCYFDKDGRWVTQTPFETLQAAIDHGRDTFEIAAHQWRWDDPGLPVDEDLLL